MAKKKSAKSKGTVTPKMPQKATKPEINEEATVTEKKKPDTKFIMLIVACAIIVCGTLGILTTRSIKNLKPKATTEASTEEKGTMTSQEIERKALYEEHDALFSVLRDVYWLGKFDEYKTLIPLEAWQEMADEMEMTIEEVYVAAEKELSEMEILGNDVRFYIASLNVMSGTSRDNMVASFNNMYGIPVEDFGQVCVMDIEMVHISPEGEKTSTDEVYYSFVIRGERYLATDSGFVG